MSELPDKIVRFDVVKVEYGRVKMCRCREPHYEVDYQNRLVYCADCGAIVDPFEALVHISRDTKRWEEYIEQLLEQRRQIENYQPRRVVIKELEKLYVTKEKSGCDPTCPKCGQPFPLKALLSTRWCKSEFITRTENTE